jgi:hypothetical protein
MPSSMLSLTTILFSFLDWTLRGGSIENRCRAGRAPCQGVDNFLAFWNPDQNAQIWFVMFLWLILQRIQMVVIDSTGLWNHADGHHSLLTLSSFRFPIPKKQGEREGNAILLTHVLHCLLEIQAARLRLTNWKIPATKNEVRRNNNAPDQLLRNPMSHDTGNAKTIPRPPISGRWGLLLWWNLRDTESYLWWSGPLAPIRMDSEQISSFPVIISTPFENRSDNE